MANPIHHPDLILVEDILAVAARSGAADDIAKLVAALDADASDLYGESALHFAAKRGLPLLCAALARAHPALLGARDNFGFTPLMIASQAGEAACAKILLPGSELEARSLSGRTAFLLACACDKKPADPDIETSARLTMAALVAAGADPRAKNNTGGGALHVACAAGSIGAIEMALGILGPDELAELDHNGRSPLQLARTKLPPAVAAALEARSIEASLAQPAALGASRLSASL